MTHWFEVLLPLDRFFLLCALAGTMGVILRLATQFLGFGSGGHDGDIEMGDGDHHLGDGFKIISFHGLSAFFMMFGLVGFAANRGGIPTFAVILGVVAGAASVWVITKLFKMANKLQSVGNLDTNKAIGCNGTVYMQIPKGGSGRVIVNIGGRQREMDALHINGEAVATGTKIMVHKIDGAVAIVDLLSPQ